MKKDIATFVINGQVYEEIVEANTTLADLLREKVGLTGTKRGCSASGNCGACTVLLDGQPILSCLTLAWTVRGRDITTIEGLAGPGGLHMLQQTFLDHGAVQCGYCTPGMILAAKALLDENPTPSEKEIREGLAGNLCRCTGYVKIVEAVRAAAQNAQTAISAPAGITTAATSLTAREAATEPAEGTSTGGCVSW
jgi:aerobic carbon-monoxide dehydrogenase small subunit